jgi:hypothetical protein
MRHSCLSQRRIFLAINCKNVSFNTLSQRNFCAPDTAALDFASSNFTAQALAAWRTHDTNSIISFAQNALATNATPEAMLFRGTAAYNLENDYIGTTNLVYSANKIIDESRIHTPK